MTAPGRKRPHGQMRQSQVVTTFGPGAMIDLPNNAVMLSGLEHWRGVDRQIFEERLAAKVQQLLAVPSIKLFPPPPEHDDPTATPAGIAVWLFPLWFVAQYEEKRERNVRSRPLVHYQALIKDRYVGADRKSYPVVPIRFVQACTRGHISDIDWHLYVHEHGNPCRRPLWLDERGTSGDLADVTVRCECGRTKTMAAAAKFQDRPFGYCGGHRPWLGPAAREHCGGSDAKSEPSRLLVRSASNAYFAQKLSAISIPDASAAIRAAVDAVFEDFLQYVESPDEIARERRKARVHAALEGLTDDEVWREIQRRKRSHVPRAKGIKQAEIETLLSSMVGTTEDVPDGDYFARALPDLPRSPLLTSIDRVVLVHRLREVIAQVGFTRFESAVPDVDGELSLDVKRADLALETTWVPAVENRGEGFFVAVKTEAIEAWRARPTVQARGNALLAGFDAWKADHPGTKTEFPGLPYVMLHTLSHLLITAVSLECGYASTSIRERVYATRSGYGILLYTGTSDAEGTIRDRRVLRDEEKLLLDAALQQMNTPKHQCVGPLLHDRIIGALELCCRRGEMLLIQNKRVNWESYQIGIPGATAKDRENRRIPFDPEGRLAAILERRAKLGPDAYVFGSATGTYQPELQTAWETLRLLAHGIEPRPTTREGATWNAEQVQRIDLRWHDLRHEGACRLLADGVDIRIIQLMLGHASIQQTQRYLNVTDEELRRGLEVSWNNKRRPLRLASGA